MIDAHQHFWQLSRGDYAWLTPDLDVLHRDFLPPDLEPAMRAEGITRTVVVQAAPTVAETRFLLELAGKTEWIAGVVGWIDFEAPRAADELAALGSDPRFVGVRPMIQDVEDPDWMLGDALSPAFEALVARGLAFDALVRPEHLPRLLRLSARHPALRVVVDHGAKPDIAGRAFDAWAEPIAALARESSAVCKLSGLVTEALAGWSVDDLRPYVDHLFETFGPERLMWGSDWPVVELAGGYVAWADATRVLLGALDARARAEVREGTASRFYRLGPGARDAAVVGGGGAG